MPGPLGHIISNPYKNPFPQVGMSPFYRGGSGRCQGSVALSLALVGREGGREGAEGHQSHTPEESLTARFPHSRREREKKSGKQIRLRGPRAWGIQGEPGVSCE